ncbi:MAG: hypothetical protein AAF357_14810 [Verrucomicrobiota bacterium]
MSQTKETTFSRRDLLKLGSGLAASGLVTILNFSSAVSERPLPVGRLGKIDYTKANATPTVCFGCTNHCGVVGWVQDGRVRRIDGNPLDPNTEGNICSKAQGMISYTYYPERLLYPLRRPGKAGALVEDPERRTVFHPSLVCRRRLTQVASASRRTAGYPCGEDSRGASWSFGSERRVGAGV